MALHFWLCAFGLYGALLFVWIQKQNLWRWPMSGLCSQNSGPAVWSIIESSYSLNLFLSLRGEYEPLQGFRRIRWDSISHLAQSLGVSGHPYFVAVIQVRGHSALITQRLPESSGGDSLGHWGSQMSPNQIHHLPQCPFEQRIMGELSSPVPWMESFLLYFPVMLCLHESPHLCLHLDLMVRRLQANVWWVSLKPVGLQGVYSTSQPPAANHWPFFYVFLPAFLKLHFTLYVHCIHIKLLFRTRQGRTKQIKIKEKLKHPGCIHSEVDPIYISL